MPPIPGLDLPGVFKMRTVQDAAALKADLDSGAVKSGLVIGASWVGIKVVEDLVERSIPCTLVDGAPWMFSVAAFEQTARRVEADLRAKGVEVSCGQMLDHIEQAPGGRLTAVMQTGDRFTADPGGGVHRCAHNTRLFEGQRHRHGPGRHGGQPHAHQF